jgi:hypothetical protein
MHHKAKKLKCNWSTFEILEHLEHLELQHNYCPVCHLPCDLPAHWAAKLKNPEAASSLQARLSHQKPHFFQLMTRTSELLSIRRLEIPRNANRKVGVFCLEVWDMRIVNMIDL